MLNNAPLLCVLLLIVAALVAVGWIVLGPLVPFFLALILVSIAMVIMVVMLITFPKEPG